MNKKIGIIIVAILIAFGVGYFINNKKDTAPSQAGQSDSNNTTPSSTALDLSGQQLTTLTEAVWSRSDLTSINLSNNQFVILPAEISRMTNLEVLNIENNRLESLPAELSSMENLQEILANNNRLSSLPTELGYMTWLKLLDISGNNIPAEDVSQIKAQLTNTQVKN